MKKWEMTHALFFSFFHPFIHIPFPLRFVLLGLKSKGRMYKLANRKTAWEAKGTAEGLRQSNLQIPLPSFHSLECLYWPKGGNMYSESCRRDWLLEPSMVELNSASHYRPPRWDLRCKSVLRACWSPQQLSKQSPNHERGGLEQTNRSQSESWMCKSESFGPFCSAPLSSILGASKQHSSKLRWNPTQIHQAKRFRTPALGHAADHRKKCLDNSRHFAGHLDVCSTWKVLMPLLQLCQMKAEDQVPRCSMWMQSSKVSESTTTLHGKMPATAL